MSSADIHARAGKAIRLESVGKLYGEARAVQRLDLEIPVGSFTVLLGPSGCGKSTTLRMIAGLESCDEGRILIGGENVTTAAPSKRDISMVFQSYALFPHLSVAENIVFGLKVRREGRAVRDAKLAKVAELLGLTALLERKPGQLSGGQQQRVALGRAIISEKPVCLMDEPLSNLDAKLRHEMRVEIRALQQRLGFTMVYVTHDQVEAITMADQVVLLNGGKLEQVSDPRHLYDRPETPFAARFIGMPPMNLIPLSALKSEAPRDLMIGVRPEALTVSEAGPLRGNVLAVEFLGADTLIDCALGSATFQARLPGGKTFSVGEEVRFDLQVEDLHVFDQATGLRRDELISEIGSQLRSQQLC
ncbi:ABC transporter ATP-binding protein [Roseibium sp.]|uniref:ABC transporter ATP-binding protein n=1 Tax=Roseibium sp. TaxID=1936156 RepID=UPI003A9884BD